MNKIAPRLARQCLYTSIMLLPAYAFAQQDAQTTAALSPTAVVKLEPLGSGRVSGTMTLEQVGQSVAIKGTVNGLTPGKHGIHIHEGRSCKTRGGHLQAGNTPHGAPEAADDKHHLGDLGNVIASDDGTAQYSGTLKNASLTGSNPIAGRVLVIHQGADDLASQPSGGSGEQIACGVIKASPQ
jgi:superoxide dismutase, Cu-Zn family